MGAVPTPLAVDEESEVGELSMTEELREGKVATFVGWVTMMVMWVQDVRCGGWVQSAVCWR